MKLIAIALPAVAAAGFFVGIRAETPWLGPRSSELFSVAGSNVALGGGQSLTLSTVPSDRRLVITAIRLVDFSGGGSYSTDWLEVEEVDATGVTHIRGPTGVFDTGHHAEGGGVQSTGHGDGLGIVFSPGASLNLRNVSSAGAINFSYYLAGYLTPK